MTWPQFLRLECTVARRIVRLGKAEANVLLVLLVGHPDKPLLASEIVARVWAADEEPEQAEPVVRAAIANMRRKRIMIETILQFGYRLPARRRAPDRPHCLQPGRCRAKTERECTACVNVANGQRTHLTAKQERLLGLIRDNPPMTHPEMQRALGYKSKSTIEQMLERLERKGVVRTSHSRHRSTRLASATAAG